MDFDQFDAVLLDLDGTIYHEEHALPGAVELIRRLQRERRRFACLSNSTSSPARIAARLARMGVEVPAEVIYTAGLAAADYVIARARGGRPAVYSLATEGVHELLEQQVHWVVHEQDPCDVVLVGTPTSLYATEPRQRTALELLRRNPGTLLVGICADRVYPSPRGMEFGSGALTMMLAYAAHRTPIFTGKPEPIFFRDLCKRLGVATDRCVLIGDNLESDIGGAKRVGMKTILTLTGVARRDDLPSAAATLQPDWVIESLETLKEA